MQDFTDFGKTEESFYSYWLDRFPSLVSNCYQVVSTDHTKEADYFKTVYGPKNAEAVAEGDWREKLIPKTILECRNLQHRSDASMVYLGWKPFSNILLTAGEDASFHLRVLTVSICD